MTKTVKLTVIAFLAFVSLGMPDALFGVAWPSIRSEFGAPLGQFGFLLIAATSGYLLSSFVSGPVVARLGIGKLLLASNLCVIVSLAMFATAPSWPVFVAAGILAGLGGGSIDAGINNYAAHNFSPRMITWLHGCYGVGAMIGPVLMTAVLAQAMPWRYGYALVGALLLPLTVCFALTARLWGAAQKANSRPEADGESAMRAPLLGSLRHRPALITAAIFFLYVGLESTAGQLSYTLMTEGRNIDMRLAGSAVGGFWISLAMGRLVFGTLAHYRSEQEIMRWGIRGAAVGAVLFAVNLGTALTISGLLLTGFSFGPIYPMLMSLTPRIVGGEHAGNAVGFNVAAGTVGFAAIPTVTAAVAARTGLEIVSAVVISGTTALLLVLMLRGGSQTDAIQEAATNP